LPDDDDIDDLVDSEWTVACD